MTIGEEVTITTPKITAWGDAVEAADADAMPYGTRPRLSRRSRYTSQLACEEAGGESQAVTVSTGETQRKSGQEPPSFETEAEERKWLLRMCKQRQGAILAMHNRLVVNATQLEMLEEARKVVKERQKAWNKLEATKHQNVLPPIATPKPPNS